MGKRKMIFYGVAALFAVSGVSCAAVRGMSRAG